MKKIKNYYLIIPAKDIYKKEIKDNEIIIDKEFANIVFNKHSIPEEYKKIILKIPFNNIKKPNDAFELTTNEMYYFKTPLIKTILDSNNKKIYLQSRNTLIVAEIKLYSSKYIKEYLNDIINSKLAKDYLDAVSEITEKNISLNKDISLTKKRKR